MMSLNLKNNKYQNYDAVYENIKVVLEWILIER